VCSFHSFYVDDTHGMQPVPLDCRVYGEGDGPNVRRIPKLIIEPYHPFFDGETSWGTSTSVGDDNSTKNLGSSLYNEESFAFTLALFG